VLVNFLIAAFKVGSCSSVTIFIGYVETLDEVVNQVIRSAISSPRPALVAHIVQEALRY
jgi:hypothetical protein